LLFQAIIAFSQFLTTELATASNIKDRANRQSVIRVLKKISEKTKLTKYPKGIFIFAGIDQYGKEIYEQIEPHISLDIFYYNCGNKFKIDNVEKYISSYNGTIIFANGDECIIYQIKDKFVKYKHLNANLIKRHKKGGQSSLRFSRLAEESRQQYITHIIDYLNSLQTAGSPNNNWIFGSGEILDMIFESKSKIYVEIIRGGFLDFNSKTIDDFSRWIRYLDNSNPNDKTNIKMENILKQFVSALDTEPDLLEFDQTNQSNTKYYIKKNPSKTDIDSNKYICLNSNSEYYNRLCMFDYIGLRYYKLDCIFDD
jgi:hypothetical protein